MFDELLYRCRNLLYFVTTCRNVASYVFRMSRRKNFYSVINVFDNIRNVVECYETFQSDFCLETVRVDYDRLRKMYRNIASVSANNVFEIFTHSIDNIFSYKLETQPSLFRIWSGVAVFSIIPPPAVTACATPNTTFTESNIHTH